MPNLYTSDEIKNMSYTDFVGFINQWNVPPGAFNTLTSWMVFGGITDTSSILELACTTGFSCREIALATNAKAVGIDISEASVEAAIKNKAAYAPNTNVTYQAMNALNYNSDEKYSHVIIGAALRFFPDPSAAVSHIVGLLAPNGLLLSTEFYCDTLIPSELVDEAYSVFNIHITQQNYKEVMSVYQGLTLIHEERHSIMLETADELAHYCDSTMNRFIVDNPGYDELTLKTIRDRLLKIKDMSNRLRPYQKYNVLVHRPDARFYPDRYTELF